MYMITSNYLYEVAFFTKLNIFSRVVKLAVCVKIKMSLFLNFHNVLTKYW